MLAPGGPPGWTRLDRNITDIRVKLVFHKNASLRRWCSQIMISHPHGINQRAKISPAKGLGPEIRNIHQQENTLLVTWGRTWVLKMSISRAPGLFQKWEFDTLWVSMSPRDSCTQKDPQNHKIYELWRIERESPGDEMTIPLIGSITVITLHD